MTAAGQFDAAKLCPFDNDWSNVHDFTVNKDVPNWTLLPQVQCNAHCTTRVGISQLSGVQDTRYVGLIDSLDKHTLPGFVVPPTWGSRPRKKTEVNNPKKKC